MGWFQKRAAALALAPVMLSPLAMASPATVLPSPAPLPAVLRLNALPWDGSALPPLADAAPLTAFVQVAPLAGAPPRRRTELRMVHDGKVLRIQVHAFDPEPGAIVAQQMRRDVEAMLAEDCIILVFDPEGTGRNGYLFAVNAFGAQFDALIFDGGQMRHDWDALWHSEARTGTDGWSADIAIPLSVFGVPNGTSDPGMWRFNAERWMPRSSERVRLAGIQPDKEVYSLGDALPMPVVVADRQGWGLRLKPSVRLIGESAAASGIGHARRRIAPGLEVFHQSESGLRTTAAFNIDFGEAEADERTVNLTRFELFRPEKREFFLQDAGRFTFGGLVESAVMPYYSRRIGLDGTGRARSLDAGLKFSGNVSGLDFGVFGARVAGGPILPGQPDQRAADVAVLRMAQPVTQHNRLGLIATRGNPEGTSGSSLWGIDYQYRDTNWLGGNALQGAKTLEMHTWLQQSANSVQGTGRAWGASVFYPNVGLTGKAEVQRIDKHFAPALGYLAEAGVLRGKGELGWWHRTPQGQDIVPGVDWNFRRKLDGSERSLLLNPEIAFTNAAGDMAMAEIFVETDRLASGYAPVPGTWLAPGSYRWHYLFGYLETSPSRPVSAIAELRSGGYYDGRRNDQALTLNWKPAPYWGVRLGASRSAISLPSGNFTVRTATLRLDHTPSTRLAQSLLLQWDNVSQALGVSARLRWMWAPGQELVFALDRLGYTDEQRTLQPQQTRAMLKLVWNLER